MQCGGWTLEWQGCRGNDFTKGTTIWQAVKARCAEFTVGEGEVLFYPSNWWHQVRWRWRGFCCAGEITTHALYHIWAAAPGSAN